MVVGTDAMPGRGLTLVVAGLIAGAALTLAGRAGALRPVDGGRLDPLWRLAAPAVAGVLGLRGAVGLAVGGRAGSRFAHWDRRVYSPLCLLLAGCAAVVEATAEA